MGPDVMGHIAYRPVQFLCINFLANNFTGDRINLFILNFYAIMLYPDLRQGKTDRFRSLLSGAFIHILQ